MRLKEHTLNNKIDFLFLCFLLTNVLGIEAKVFPTSPEPWRDAYNISVEEVEFQHPMTVVNQSDLDIIKLRIENKVEPQFSSYKQLIEEAELLLDFTAGPPKTLRIPGGYVDAVGLGHARELLWRNCHPAYTHGLAYTLTKENRHAEKAKEILMDWANKNTTFTDGDRGLQLGSWFSPMLYAADLNHDYDGWSDDDRITFKAWWRKNILEDGRAPLEITFDASGSTDAEGDDLPYSWDYGDQVSDQMWMTIEVAPILSVDLIAALYQYTYPSTGLVSIDMNGFYKKDIQIFDLAGKSIDFKWISKKQILVKHKGAFLMLVATGNVFRIEKIIID